MSTVWTYPDVEGGLKAWLPTVPQVAALVGDRVFFSIPDNTEWPLIVITQVAGGPESSATPLNVPWIQLDCWAAPVPGARKPRKKQASDLALSVCGALMGLTSGTVAGSCRFLGAQVLSCVFEPNSETNQARYAVTAEISATAPTA